MNSQLLEHSNNDLYLEKVSINTSKMGVGPRGDQVSIASIGKDLDKVNAIEAYNGNQYTNIGLSDEDAEFFDTFPEDKKKRMIRKIDIRLVPVLALLYLAG